MDPEFGKLLEIIEPTEERGPLQIGGHYIKIFTYGASALIGIGAVILMLLVQVFTSIFNPGGGRSFDAFIRFWLPITGVVALWCVYAYFKLKNLVGPEEPEVMQTLDIYQDGLVLRTKDDERRIAGIAIDQIQILFDIDDNGALVFDRMAIKMFNDIVVYKTTESKVQYAFDAIRQVAARAHLPAVMERFQEETEIVFEDFQLMPEGIGVLSYNPLKPRTIDNLFVAYRDFEALRWNWPSSVFIMGKNGQKLGRLMTVRRFPEDEPKKTSAAINPDLFYLDLAIMIGRKHIVASQLEEGGPVEQLPG